MKRDLVMPIIARLKKTGSDKIISLILVIAILGISAILYYVIATSGEGGRSTEFYILGEDGKAENYLEQTRVGETGTVVVGIANHESYAETYRIKVVVDGAENNEAGPIKLEPGEIWQAAVGFTAERPGSGQKVELLLFEQGKPGPFSASLQLWVDVLEW